MAASEQVLATLEARCAPALADLRALLAETLLQPGATLETVLAVLAREWFQGEDPSQARGGPIATG